MLASPLSVLRVGNLYFKLTRCSIRFFRTGSAMKSPDYSTWKAEQLVAKVQALEQDLREANERCRALASSPIVTRPEPPPRRPNKFDPAKYSTRLIALKFAYLGQNYNGLEYALGNVTPLPTVEEVLWAALTKGHLVMPTDQAALDAKQVTWEGCDYTKCGRTDRGVSAFGQVVGLRVRSNRPLPGRRKKAVSSTDEHEQNNEDSPAMSNVEAPFDPIKDEIPYVHALNRLLPPDIRALAWCGELPEDFSARFSCRERRYKYFFTNPAFTPTPGTLGITASKASHIDQNGTPPQREGWLDIAAMQDAAKRFEGLHDFRNLSKIDASKQLTDFRRRIFLSEVRKLDHASASAVYVNDNNFDKHGNLNTLQKTGKEEHVAGGPAVYEFELHGSAFLWHQVRHMVAILFLVGQGLEEPDVVDRLLDVKNCPRKPHYEMADDAPLVLWDCIFPDLDSRSRKDALKWIYAGDEAGSESKHSTALKGKYGNSGIVDALWEVWRERKMEEILAGSLLNLAVSQGENSNRASGPSRNKTAKVFLGGGSAPPRGPYVPIMDRPCGEHFEVVNAKYAAKKGLIPKSEAELQELRERRRDRRQDPLEEYVE